MQNYLEFLGIQFIINAPDKEVGLGAFPISLGLNNDSKTVKNGPRITINFSQDRKIFDVDKVGRSSQSTYLSINVPKMMGSFPCYVKYSMLDGYSHFELYPQIHLKQNLLHRFIFKLLTADFFDLTEHEISSLKYYVIRRIMEICLLNTNKSFLHASAIYHEGGTYLLTGQSRVGKTTLVIGLLDGNKCEIMADDFPIVTNDGLCHPNPEPVNIEPSIEKLNNKITSWIGQQNLFNQAHWYLRTKFFGDKRTLRRVPLNNLGRYHPSSCEIKKIYLLNRSQIDDLQIIDISPREMARISAVILRNELEPVTGLLDQNHFNKSSILDIQLLMNRAEKLYRDCFSDKKCYSLLIPEGYDMRQATNFLFNHFKS